MNPPDYDVEPDPNNPLRALIEAARRGLRGAAERAAREFAAALKRLNRGPPTASVVHLHPRQLDTLSTTTVSANQPQPERFPPRRLNRAQRRALARGRR